MIPFKKTLKLTLPLILGGFLVWYSLREMEFYEILNYFKEANYWWIGLAIVLGTLSNISRAYRWKYLLEPMGYKTNSTNRFLAVSACYLINLTIPRAGEISRATVLKNYDNVPFEKSIGTIIAERVIDVVLMLCILSVTLIIQFDYILGLILKKEVNFHKLLIIGVVFSIFTLGLIIFVRKSENRFLSKIKKFFKGLIEGVLSIFKLKHKWRFLFHSIFIWLMYILTFWITTFSISNFNVPISTVLVGFIAGTLSTAVTNGGMGGYPLAVAAVFSNIFNYGDKVSTAFGWIMWSSQTIMLIVFGGIAFVILPIYNSNKKA